MGSIINTFAYPRIPLSYDADMPHLKMIDIHGYIIPVRHYILNNKLNTLLMSHSNGEDIGMIDIEKISHLFNCNIVIYDYSSIGLHSCKEKGEEYCKKDIYHTYEYLLQYTSPDKIILYGRSLGTGPATWLAYHLSCQHQPCKLILVSPFRSIIKTMINIPLPFDQFNNEALAPSITCPVLIIHGCNDNVTNHAQSVQLSKKFKNLQKFVTVHGAGHHCLLNRPQYITAVKEFVN